MSSLIEEEGVGAPAWGDQEREEEKEEEEEEEEEEEDDKYKWEKPNKNNGGTQHRKRNQPRVLSIGHHISPYT